MKMKMKQLRKIIREADSGSHVFHGEAEINNIIEGLVLSGLTEQQIRNYINSFIDDYFTIGGSL